MLRPKRDDKPVTNAYNKFARIFGMLMSLLYVGLGLFIMFASDKLRLTLPDNIKYLLGGILILYGIVRFVRVFITRRSNKNRYED